MFFQITKFKEEHKKLITIVEILLFPLIMILLDIIIRTIHNTGLYFGTFLRGIFEYFV